MATIPMEPHEISAHRARIPWSVGAQHALIARARDHRVLWDHTHEYYAKKIPKRVAWKVVAAGLRQDFPELDALDLNEDDVQAKFSTLKSYYQRELRRIQSSSSEGGAVQGSKWEFFRSFSFMHGDDDYPTYPTTSTTLPPDYQPYEYLTPETAMKISDEDYHVSGGEGEENEAPLTPSPTPSSSSADHHNMGGAGPPHKKKKRKSPTEQMIDKTIIRINNILNQNVKASEDIADKTGDLVRNFLFMLSKPKKKELSMKIIRLLQEEALSDHDMV